MMFLPKTKLRFELEERILTKSSIWLMVAVYNGGVSVLKKGELSRDTDLVERLFLYPS